VIRPYLAVVIDSFRSAFASRVLWVALIAIYIFLFAIAPIGYREVFTTTFRWPDFANGTRMKAMLARGIAELDNQTDASGDGGKTSAAKETPPGRIARSLPAELQGNLRKVAEGQEVRIRLDVFADGLNQLYENDDWYDAEVWKSTPRLRELREIESLDQSELSKDMRKRRDRLRIEAALPGVFENRGSRSIALTYAGLSFPAVLQIEKPQFQMLLNQIVLRIIIEWVLGFAMIFLGILVTAAIIPDMLQPGSLHLLLSKPVSRGLLFLAKFIGGCAFVFVCVTQLIIGLWLIAGLRLDVWNARLLLCIPVCVFLFAVFYSVSAVAGLKWRSPILAIGLANVFGAACLVIGMAGGLSDGFVVERDRISGFTVSGDTIITATRGGHLRRFDPVQSIWVNLFPDDNGSSDRIIPPVTLSGSSVATARVRGGRMNVFGSGATPLLLVDPKPGTIPEPSIELPAGTLSLHAMPDGAILAHNSGELMIARAADLRPLNEPENPEDGQSDGDAAGGEKADDAKADAGSGFGMWLPKLMKMMGGPSDGFYSVLPEGVTLTSPSSVAVSQDGNSLMVLSGGRVIRLDRPATSPAADSAQARWIRSAQAEVTVPGRTAWLRYIGDSVVVLLQPKNPPLFFTDSLQPIEVDAGVVAKISDLSVLAAVSCHSANALVIQATNGQASVIRVDDQQAIQVDRLGRTSNVESLWWDNEKRELWVAQNIDQIAVWNFSDLKAGKLPSRPEREIRPSISGWRMVERYVVTPLRTITPQTGELGDTIASIVSGEDALQLPFASAGEPAIIERYNVWRPVLTCGGFIAFMLLIGCVYFSRTDF
jgi:ABC-type transport system involved in multi-copper enzyme maturation permease subunit